MPQDIKSQYGLACAYREIGDDEKAIEAFSKVIELGPGPYGLIQGKAIEERGHLYAGKGLRGKAIQDYTRLIERFPEYPGAYVFRALSYRAMGNCDSAVLDLTKAISLSPSNELLFRERARVYYLLGQYEKSLADLETYEKLGGKVDPKTMAAVRAAAAKKR